MRFLSDLDVRVIDKEDHPEGKTGFFMVLTDFTYEGSEHTIIVPAGTLIDFASQRYMTTFTKYSTAPDGFVMRYLERLWSAGM